MTATNRSSSSVSRDPGGLKPSSCVPDGPLPPRRSMITAHGHGDLTFRTDCFVSPALYLHHLPSFRF